jgi:hypothetical protein
MTDKEIYDFAEKACNMFIDTTGITISVDKICTGVLKDARNNEKSGEHSTVLVVVGKWEVLGVIPAREPIDDAFCTLTFGYIYNDNWQQMYSVSKFRNTRLLNGSKTTTYDDVMQLIINDVAGEDIKGILDL